MQTKIFQLITFLSLSLLLANPVLAMQNNFFSYSNFRDPTVTIQLGGFNASQGINQHIGINGLLGDQFTVNQNHKNNYLVGLGYFLQGLTKDNTHLLYGLNAFYLAPTTVKGNIYQEQQTTPNLSYQYDLTNYPIYLALKSIFNTQHSYNLMADFGVGANIIKADNFTENSLDGFTLPDHIFSSNTDASWSITLGVGIQFPKVLGCLPLEVSYRYFYLGQGQLTKKNNQVLDTLSTGHNYANALIISTSF